MSNGLTVKVGGLTVFVDELPELQKLLEAARGRSLPSDVVVPAVGPSNGDLEVLYKSDMSAQTVSQVVNRLFGMKLVSKDLAHAYPEIKQHATQWLQREIIEKIQFIYVAIVEVQVIGEMTAVVGLNTENKLVILALEAETNVAKVLRTLVARGFKVPSDMGAILGYDKAIEDAVLEVFPKVNILRCWLETVARAPERHRDILRELEQSPSLAAAQKALANVPMDLAKTLKPRSKELFAYFQYAPELWRVLRRTSPMHRFKEELRRKRIKNTTRDQRSAWLLTTWACLRLQYQWYRIPVDSTQLSTLKYMKAEVSTEPTSNRGIRRRSTESKKES